MKTSRWLLLLYALPTRRNAERVNLWRKLKKFGAVPLKSSGYILPNDPTHLERFQWLSNQIQDAGGEATLIRVAEIEGVPCDQVVEMFNEARAADYKELATACQAVLSNRKRQKSADLETELPKFKKRFGEIKEIDYFNSPAAHDAEMVLQRMEGVLAPRKGHAPVKKLEAADYAGRTWLTRPRPGIDRAGSAWLIRKFIDAKAKFVFALEPSDHPNALPFDMAGVEFSHQGDDCTFETLVKRFGISDAAVQTMAKMVHDADLEDDKFRSIECVGINRVLSGWARTGIPDAELLAKGMECFEGLYQSLRKGGL